MNIYLLKRRNDTGGSDEVEGFVIIAKTAYLARMRAAQSKGDEPAVTWLDPEHSSCYAIGKNTTEAPGIVLRAFRYG